MLDKIDVLFVHSRNFQNARSYLKLPSIELTYMSAILNNAGYTDYLMDCNIDDIDESFTKLAPDINPSVVLVYGGEHNHINVLDNIKKLREIYPKAKIGVCGIMVSFLAERLMNQLQELDFVVLKTGDYVVRDLLDNNFDYEFVSGIVYRDDASLKKNIPQSYSLNDLPLPNRSLYDAEKYLKYSPETIVRSSRGCPSNCYFCNKTVFEKFSNFSMEHFFSGIDDLLNLGYETFFFADDTFAYSDKRLKEFCDYYSKNSYKFRWASNLRVSDVTPDRLKNIRNHGGYRVFVGMETINMSSNKLMNKVQNNKDYHEVVELIKENDLELHASFIIGNPGDTLKDLETTSQFICETKPDVVSFNTLKLFPGTKIFDNPEIFGIIPEDKFWFENPEWVERTLIGTNELTPAEIDKQAIKMKSEYYLSL